MLKIGELSIGKPVVIGFDLCVKVCNMLAGLARDHVYRKSYLITLVVGLKVTRDDVTNL